MQNDLRIAILIDADNAPRKSLKGIMEEIAVYGTPTIKRIYGDWTTPNLTSWKTSLLENAITPIQQYGYTSRKNSTDSAMIIDAMDILYSGNVDAFCIVSSDSDFTRLAIRLREAGMKVFGIGEKKTPNPFIVACDKFIYIEIIQQPTIVSTPKTKKKPDKTTDNPQTLETQNEKKIPKDIYDFICETIENVAGDDGWAYLGEVGGLLIKKQPDFDARNFGFKKLTQLFEAVDSFEIDSRVNLQKSSGKLIYIRNKKT